MDQVLMFWEPQTEVHLCRPKTNFSVLSMKSNQQSDLVNQLNSEVFELRYHDQQCQD